MRVLVIGDAHGDAVYLQNAINLAQKHNCTFVHIVGDFGFWTHTWSGRDFLKAVDECAKLARVTVTFTDGNHENFTELYKIPVDDDGWRRVTPHIWHAPRGHVWEWEGTTFMSLGGASSIDGPDGPDWHIQARGPARNGQGRLFFVDGSYITVADGYDLGGWWPEEVLADSEIGDAIANAILFGERRGGKTVNVLFTHDCPIRTALDVAGYQAGHSNRARVQQVLDTIGSRFVIHGHYHFWHQSRQKSGTEVIGLSRNDRFYGQYIFLETDPTAVLTPSQKEYEQL